MRHVIALYKRNIGKTGFDFYSKCSHIFLLKQVVSTNSRLNQTHMRAFQLFVNVDSSLGRVDYSLLSDQNLLIEGFDDVTKRRYKDSEGMYLDVCEWPHIKCDDDEKVIHIDIQTEGCSGSLDICHFPPEVNVVKIRPRTTSKITGSVDLAHLPH